MQQVADVARLRDGWLGSGSLAPSPDVLVWMRTHVSLLAERPEWQLIPLEDGSVAITFESGDAEYRAELRRGNVLYTFVDHLKADTYEEHLNVLTEERLRAFLSVERA